MRMLLICNIFFGQNCLPSHTSLPPLSPFHPPYPLPSSHDRSFFFFSFFVFLTPARPHNTQHNTPRTHPPPAHPLSMRSPISCIFVLCPPTTVSHLFYSLLSPLFIHPPPPVSHFAPPPILRTTAALKPLLSKKMKENAPYRFKQKRNNNNNNNTSATIIS